MNKVDAHSGKLVDSLLKELRALRSRAEEFGFDLTRAVAPLDQIGAPWRVSSFTRTLNTTVEQASNLSSLEKTYLLLLLEKLPLFTDVEVFDKVAFEASKRIEEHFEIEDDE